MHLNPSIALLGMLGVRREAVTECAQKLQKAGLIRYLRGQIKVLDRPGPPCQYDLLHLPLRDQ